MAVDSAVFKHVLRHWPSGVTVITTRSDEKWIGVTATAFNSVSADPPLVLVCLHLKLYTHRVIEDAGVFAVNVLSAGQVEIGKRFAGMIPNMPDRFAGLNCTTAVTGCPLLPDTAAWLDCELRDAYPAGDHTIFVGEVVAAYGPDHVEPLVYHDRQWGQFTTPARSS